MSLDKLLEEQSNQDKDVVNNDSKTNAYYVIKNKLMKYLRRKQYEIILMSVGGPYFPRK